MLSPRTNLQLIPMSSRARRRGKDRMRQSFTAPLSVGALLLSVFLVVGFRTQDLLVLTGGVALISMAGYFLGRAADRRIRRHHMVIQGHAAALIGMWGNLALLALSVALFLFELARSVIRGDIDL